MFINTNPSISRHLPNFVKFSLPKKITKSLVRSIVSTPVKRNVQPSGYRSFEESSHRKFGVGALLATGIGSFALALQFSDRASYEHETVKKAGDIKSQLTQKNQHLIGWHPKFEGLPIARTEDGSIPFFRNVLIAGPSLIKETKLPSDKGIVLCPVVSIVPTTEVSTRVHVGDISGVTQGGKPSNNVPEIDDRIWGGKITSEGEKKGNIKILTDKDIVIDWAPPYSWVRDEILTRIPDKPRS